MSRFDEHRKYIHELANTLSILDGNVARVLTLLTRNHPEMKEEISKLMKADEYSKKSIHTLKIFRERVHKMIAEDAAEQEQKK